MKAETFSGIEIDRCSTCRGILLDYGELERLIKMKVAGDADNLAFSAISETMDTVAAHCHDCNRAMITRMGPGQIRVEYCERCNAIFFDEGELATLQLQLS